jgi:putative endonuclease
LKTIKQEKGRLGEDAALCYLEDLGYMCLYRNWRWGKLEIDLILAHGNLRVFVEVKWRKDYLPAHSCMPSSAQQNRITEAAHVWLKRYAPDKEGRIDLLIVRETKLGLTIEHFPAALGGKP